MRKFKALKINTGKVNVRNFFNYITVILLTSFILAAILIAIPLTETISSHITYDLKTKDGTYWAKNYTLEVDNTDSQYREREINEIKSILYKRLSKAGVEKLSMNSFSQNDKEYIRIHIQSSTPQMNIDELVRNPFLVTIVTRNPEIDFEDPENPYAVYLGENYLPTEFTRESFRNIYVTSLKNSSNEYSYFALFKAWPWNTQWNTFLDEHQGQDLGVDIDGFVTPIQVPSAQPILFALPLSTTEKDDAKLISILYNSGVMPISYTLTDQQEVPIESIEANYIQVILGIIVAVLAIYSYLLLIDKTPRKVLLTSTLTTLITISVWIAYLKIASIPVDIFLLAIEALVIISILRITTENTESKAVINILLLLTTALTAILGVGYIKIFASDLLSLLILGYISEWVTRTYMYKVSKLLKV